MTARLTACGLTTWLACGFLAGSPAPAPAGFGAATRGGAGGAALAVTTLADSGPGSFRAAAVAAGPRTIRFEVAGLITLAAPLVIRQPFVTIDGSTAPGGGVCIRGDEVSIRTHDVIVRHLRFRPGDIAGREVDALNVMDDSHHVLIDHVSASWAVDENLSASGGIHDVTIQWSIIAEGLNRSVHSKGAHGYGSLVRAVGGVTLHHNLWAHNDSRNPRLGDNYGKGPYPVFDVRNNVIYDFGAIASGMTGDRLSANYVNNYIRPGPSSRGARGVIVLTDTAQASFYVEGNVIDGRDGTTDRALFDRTELEGRPLVTLVDRPFPAPPVPTTAAAVALKEVLAGAGATRPRRDEVDTRLVHEVEQRGGRIIDSQKDVGGWAGYR